MLDLQSIFDPDRKPVVEPIEMTPAELPGDWHVLWDERAAIREFDGGLPREQAEMLALQDVMELMQDIKKNCN
jgi:hypothetical protein